MTEDFRAYYMLLRRVYEMPALDAFRFAKHAFASHPEFMRDPRGTILAAIAANGERTL